MPEIFPNKFIRVSLLDLVAVHAGNIFKVTGSIHAQDPNL